MRLTIATAGSRGDVQPYVALAFGLQAAGHDVRIAADSAFETFVTGYGLDFSPLRQDNRAAFSDCVDQLGNPAAMLRWLKAHYTPGRAYFEDLLAAMRGSDAVLVAFLAFPAVHVAEALDMPWLGAFLQPWTPSRAFTWTLPVQLPGWIPEHVRGEIIWWSSRSASATTLRAMREAVDAGRQEVLGLPPAPFERYADFGTGDTPAIFGYSRHLIPEQPAWTPNQRVTGFWFLRANGWQPPAGLEEFLAAGDPPVVVGFGSVADCDAEKTTEAVLQALERAGTRAVLLGGWAGLGTNRRLPDWAMQLDEAPHDWLLARATSIVHHGGAGTTAAALRAGVPSVIVPFFGDQVFWGQRVCRLGAGPAPLKRRRLNAERLALALREATSPAMRHAAASIGSNIRAEDGVGQAVQAIEELQSRGSAAHHPTIIRLRGRA